MSEISAIKKEPGSIILNPRGSNRQATESLIRLLQEAAGNSNFEGVRDYVFRVVEGLRLGYEQQSGRKWDITAWEKARELISLTGNYYFSDLPSCLTQEGKAAFAYVFFQRQYVNPEDTQAETKTDSRCFIIGQVPGFRRDLEDALKNPEQARSNLKNSAGKLYLEGTCYDLSLVGEDKYVNSRKIEVGFITPQEVEFRVVHNLRRARKPKGSGLIFSGNLKRPGIYAGKLTIDGSSISGCAGFFELVLDSLVREKI